MVSAEIDLEGLIRAATRLAKAPPTAGCPSSALDDADDGSVHAGAAPGRGAPSDAGSRTADGPWSRAANDALSALLSAIYPRLFGYAMRITLQKNLAEDVCQETMVKIITGLGRYHLTEGRVIAAFQAWVFSIATNVYRDMLRKSSRTVPVADAQDEPTRSEESSRSTPVEDQALEQVQNEAVMDALRTLPHEQRTAFILRTYYDFSYREVGEVCRCPEGTAKSRMHNAVLALKDELKKRRML